VRALAKDCTALGSLYNQVSGGGCDGSAGVGQNGSLMPGCIAKLAVCAGVADKYYWDAGVGQFRAGYALVLAGASRVGGNELRTCWLGERCRDGDYGGGHRAAFEGVRRALVSGYTGRPSRPLPETMLARLGSSSEARAVALGDGRVSVVVAALDDGYFFLLAMPCATVSVPAHRRSLLTVSVACH
jgi:hypothetical protein